jgi:hypothetical protein
LALFSFGIIAIIIDLIRFKRNGFSGDHEDYKKLYLQNKLLLIVILAYLVETHAEKIWQLAANN